MSEPSPKLIQPLHWGLLAVAILGLAFIWLWPSTPAPTETEEITLIEPRESPAPAVEPEPTPVEKPTPPMPPQEPALQTVQPTKPAEPKASPLPALNDSDPVLLSEFQGSALHPLLTNEFLLRKAVRTVVAAANGEWVNQHYPVTPPKTPFKAEKGTALTISSKTFERYTPYVDAAQSLGAKAWVDLYQRYSPLLQEAYEELGLKEKSFDVVLKRAIKHLLTAPSYQNQALTQPSVMYLYQDKALENLPEIQKLAMRLGPHNQKRLQTLCSEITVLLP